MQTALEVIDLSISVSGRMILKDLHFSIKEGENVIVLGANGAGKSTLLKTIIGSAQNYSGSIKLFGRDLKTLQRIELAKIAAYVPQELPQDVRYSVREFVMLGRYSYQSAFGSDSVEDREKVDEVLRICGCSKFSNRSFNNLSSGERQRVMIATALAQNARILILDEPTSFLDIRQQSEVLELLKEISLKIKVSIICVTHDVNVAVYLGGSILVLVDGQLSYFSKIEDWLSSENLKLAYGREFRIIHCSESNRVSVVPM